MDTGCLNRLVVGQLLAALVEERKQVCVRRDPERMNRVLEQSGDLLVRLVQKLLDQTVVGHPHKRVDCRSAHSLLSFPVAASWLLVRTARRHGLGRADVQLGAALLPFELDAHAASIHTFYTWYGWRLCISGVDSEVLAR